jgi:serine/threonine protein kinase
MDYKNAFHLFQTLLEEGDENLSQRLLSFITSGHELFDETTKLIAAYQANKKETLVNDLINGQAETLVDDSQIHELLNTQIAQYKLTKKLGQGGMGVVYLGERNDGQLKQRVAIKFIFPSIAALAGENFLQKEAQHLANLEHANIAHIYTVGTTDTNLPYMVMEYVEGVAIDEYCENKNLDLKSRLTLFQKLCDAVHFAHQNMVIHADIKPSNILVNELGELKLMDFGIARSFGQVIDNDEEGLELRKQYLQAVSQNYASPEQIEGDQLTSACDAYSLGKLLSCILPQEGKYTELDELIKKSMEKSLRDRLSSVNEISIEIQNFIDNKPLSVVNYPKFLLLRKSFQRNKIAYVGMLGFFVFLLIFIVVLSMKNYELEWENNKNTKLLSFLKELISSADVENNMPRDFSVKDLIIQGGRKADSKFEGYEEQSLIIKNVLSRGLINLGFYEEADALIKDADESKLVENDLLEMLLNKATARHGVSKYNEAYEFYLRIERKLKLNNDFQNVIWLKTAPLMAGVLSDLGKSDEALEKIKRLNDLEYFVKEYPYDVAEVYRMTAQIYDRANDINKAEENINAAFKAIDKYADREHMFLIAINNTAGTVAFKMDKLDDAKIKYQAAYDHSIKLLGKEHPLTAFSLRNLSTVQEMSGDFESARQGYEEVKNIFYALNGEKSINVALILSDLGIVSKKIGDYENALKYFSNSLSLYKEVLGRKNRDVANLTTKVADMYYIKGEFEVALNLYKDAIDNYSSLHGKFKNHISIHTSSLAKCFAKLGKYELFEVNIQKAMMLLEDKEVSERTKKRVMSVFNDFKERT